ncbi:unnamed protein product [Malus baccata var. baccata]
MIIRRWVVVYHASVAHHRWEPYHSEGMRQAIANVDALLKKYWADITVMVFKTGASNCAFRTSLCKVCEIPRTAIRPAMLYGTECWAVKHQHVHKMGVAEMRMLRGMCGHTRKDKIENEDIRGKVGVAEIEGKMRKNRFW